MSTKRPKIETNEGPPHKTVSITANIVLRPDSTYPVIIKPYKLDVSQFGEKVRDEMTFTLTNVSDQTLSPRLVAFPNSYLEFVELPAKIEAGKTAEGRVKIRPDMLGESFQKSFTLELDDQAKSRFTVPVKRTVKDPNADKPQTTVGETTSKGH